MAKGDFISYLRVSTAKQGVSGLGLEAQREAVTRYLNGGNWHLIREVVEIESGKRNDRPAIAEALRLCRLHKATLVIAKLDRLARNVHFISSLMESDVEFIACDFPEANRLTVHIMAAFAEHEARAISERTKAALKALKARGVQLGNPQWAKTLGKARGARIEQIEKPAQPVVTMMQQQRFEGKTLRQIAENLNAIGVKTPSGHRWYASTVRAALLAPPLES